MFHLKTPSSFTENYTVFQSGAYIINRLELCIHFSKCLGMLLMSLVYFIVRVSI